MKLAMSSCIASPSLRALSSLQIFFADLVTTPAQNNTICYERPKFWGTD